MRTLIAISASLSLLAGPTVLGALGVPVLGGTTITGGGGAPGAAGLPSGCTDNTIARADGTAGATQCSAVTIEDDGDVIMAAGDVIRPADNGPTRLMVAVDDDAVSGFYADGGNPAFIRNNVVELSCNTLDCSLGSNTLTLSATGAFIQTAAALTIADSGGAGAATHTALPAAGRVRVTCSDADGCDWTITETSAVNGFCTTIVNASANNLVMKHSAGADLMPGGADVTLGQNDGMTVCYDSTVSAWLGETKDDR